MTIHYKLPLRLTPQGDFQLVEQDTPDEVAQHVHTLLRTPLGSRELHPTLGLDHNSVHDLKNDTVINTIEAQLAEHEPRAEHHIESTLTEYIHDINVHLGATDA